MARRCDTISCQRVCLRAMSGQLTAFLSLWFLPGRFLPFGIAHAVSGSQAGNWGWGLPKGHAGVVVVGPVWEPACRPRLPRFLSCSEGCEDAGTGQPHNADSTPPAQKPLGKLSRRMTAGGASTPRAPPLFLGEFLR